MKRARISLLLAALLVCCGEMAGAAMAKEKVLFEQFGPRDASLRPFFIEIGAGGDSTRDILFIGPKEFAAIREALAGLPSAGSGEQPQYSLTLLEDDHVIREKITNAEGGRHIAELARQSFLSRGEEVPPWLKALSSRR